MRAELLCCCLLSIWACDERAGRPDGEAADIRPDAEPVDAADAPESDAALVVDLGRPPDGAPDAAADCREGDHACVEEGGVGLRACLGGRWTIDRCPDGEVCTAGRCVTDPALCVHGQRTCLDALQPAECEPGVGWRPLDPCDGDELCSGAGLCRSRQCAAAEQTRSYLGCDYVSTDLPNWAWYPAGGTPDSPLGVVVANPSLAEPVRVTVLAPGGELATLVAEVEIAPPVVALGTAPVTVRSEVRGVDGAVLEQGVDSADALEVPPGGMAVLLLRNHGAVDTTGVRRHAWRVSTSAPVAAYQFGPYCCNYTFSNDASLLLPVAALGTEYVHVGVPAWADRATPDGEPGSAAPATLSLVGTAPDTDVTVVLPPGVEVEPDADGRVRVAAGVVEATLQPDDVLTLVTPRAEARREGELPVGRDLSGAHISATAPVAAFSGHLCSYYPQDQGACDHLEEQLFPTDTWGTRFVAAPAVLRAALPDSATEATFWKIVARDAGTRVEFSVPYDDLDARPPGFAGVPDCRDHLEGPRTLVLGAGATCELGTRLGFGLEATAPIEVLGIISGADSTGFGTTHSGDPAIFLLPPERQLRTQYAFLAPTTFFNDYVTVTAFAGASVELDGTPVDLADAVAVPGTDRVFKHIRIEDGPHQLTGDRAFGILVFAFDDWVSYAFTGGLNLSKQ